MKRIVSVLLALSLARPAHLYVWDEPLNYVDVLSRRQIDTANSLGHRVVGLSGDASGIGQAGR